MSLPMPILEEDIQEEALYNAWPQLPLRSKFRSTLWTLCIALGADKRGVPGQACRLVERFLYTQMRFYRALASERRRRTFLQRLIANFPLTMVSCIQLAAKMSSADIQMNAAYVRVCLISKGFRFSVADITYSELRVYSQLGFRVPLWTCVDIAEMMAENAGLPNKMLEGVELFVTVAEYVRDRLAKRVRSFAGQLQRCSLHGNRDQVTLTTLNLAAGCVMAAAQYQNFNCPLLALRLACMVRAPLCYIKCVRSCVLGITFPEIARVSRKRRREQM